jgi:hypothetical protein
MTDDTRGTLHKLLHIWPPQNIRIPNFEPELFPRLLAEAGRGQLNWLLQFPLSVSLSAFLPRRTGEPSCFSGRLPPPAHGLCTCASHISGDV